MGRLVITDTRGRVSEHALDKERVTIGRQPDNDIVLDDKAVSGHHAAIVTVLEDSFLEDLDSTNGTQINGRTAKRHALTDGDVITLGRNTARFFCDAPASANDDRTMVLRAAVSPSPPAQAVQPQVGGTSVDLATAGKPILARLRVNSGPSQGRELELSRPLTTLGRPGVQVAAITRRADGYYLMHVGGDSGRRPRINGREIGAEACKLAGNDRIELAGTKMEFLIVS